MSLKCCIFDFDGTLFDSMFIWDQAGELYLRGLGKTPLPSTAEDLRTMSLRQAAQYFQTTYALPFPVEEIMEGINRTVEAFYFHDALPKPGVTALLEQLRQAGVAMGIATATDRYQIEAALRRCGLEHYFDAIFTCSEVGHGKERPEIYRMALEHLGADRGSCVVFEDALHAVKTAKADGFPVVAVYDVSEPRQDQLLALADCYLADFSHPEAFWKFAAAL